MMAAPDASIPELAQNLDKSESVNERAMRMLRTDGKRRIGPAKGAGTGRCSNDSIPQLWFDIVNQYHHEI